MLDTLQLQSPTSYIKEVRKTDLLRKPYIIIPVKTQVKVKLSEKENHIAFSDLPFDEWNLPPQPEGYIKCSRHDFL